LQHVITPRRGLNVFPLAIKREKVIVHV